jgi:hypothetical protein
MRVSVVKALRQFGKPEERERPPLEIGTVKLAKTRAENI